MRKSKFNKSYVHPITCFVFVLLLTLIEISNWPLAAHAALPPGRERPTTAAAATASVANATAGAAPPPGSGGRLLPPPPKVKVNKCCHFGEHLDMSQTCVPGNSQHWVPLIFLINKRQYFALKGESPKFIGFEENVRPVTENNEPAAATAEPRNDLPRSAEDEGLVARSSPLGCTSDELEFFTGGDNIILFSNGSLYLRERSQFIEPRNYCVDREAALVCFPQQQQQQQKTKEKPRLRLKKCCGKYGIYNTTANNCHFEANNNQLQLPLSKTDFQIIYGFPKCASGASKSFAIAGDFHVDLLNKTTGSLLLHKEFQPADYCLELIRVPTTTTPIGNGSNDDSLATSSGSSSGGGVVKVFTCLEHFPKDVGAGAADDAEEETSSSDQVQFAVLNVGIVISVIFLGATLVCGYLMPSVHHMLHWRCQIYYVFCLFVGELLLAYTLLSGHSLRGTAGCIFIASAMHFFFLAAFFWLNTMCFNIWWTFRDFRPSSLERNQEVFRLRLYSAYAWGIPLLIATVAVCIDQLPETELLKPGFGVRSCWFSGANLEIFAYFYGPVGILLCANIMLFISTTHQLTCGLWKRDDVKSTTEKTALGKVCLKLVIVMGVTWIADVVSWLVGGPHSAWFFSDLINAMQGVFIFLVVGCQPQVWSAIKRLCCRGARQEITNTTNGVHHSSSSHGLPSLTACGETTQNTSVNTTLGAQAKIPMETVC